MSENPFRPPTLEELLLIRKSAMAVAALAVSLPNAFAAAILADRMDEYIHETKADRLALQQTDFGAYAGLLARECVVRWAATEAEALLMKPGEAPDAEPPATEALDQANVHLRLWESLDPLLPWRFESPGLNPAESVVEALSACHRIVAHTLVHGPLNPVILDCQERLASGQGVSIAWLHGRLGETSD